MPGHSAPVISIARWKHRHRACALCHSRVGFIQIHKDSKHQVVVWGHPYPYWFSYFVCRVLRLVRAQAIEAIQWRNVLWTPAGYGKWKNSKLRRRYLKGRRWGDASTGCRCFCYCKALFKCASSSFSPGCLLLSQSAYNCLFVFTFLFDVIDYGKRSILAKCNHFSYPKSTWNPYQACIIQ